MECVYSKTERFPKGPIFIAKFDYNQYTRKNLIIFKGELLEVICQDEDGWQARSLATGMEDYIPSNYVEKCKGLVYIAQFDYDQHTSEDLSFKKGEHLEIINQDDQDWWQARSLATQREGYIPYNYVQKCEGSILVVQFDYDQCTSEGLSFKKGEQLEIISQDEEDWWQARSLVTQWEGYIPSNYVQECKTIETEWMASGFFSPIKQEEAEALLRAHEEKGTFLIREHESKPGDFVLSVHDGDNVKHYHIERLDEGGFFITWRTVFNTLKELTEYYQRDSDELSVNLRHPCPQQEKPRIHNLSHKTKDMLEIPRESIHLVKKLGKGELGEVYEGLWNRTTPVAVKVLDVGIISSTDLIQEAHFWKKFQHPNIVQFYAVCTREEPLLIITELMAKESLLNYLRGDGKTQTLPQLIDMAAQIASGMAYLESFGYIHGDLTARNIMVCKNGICRVADFGLVRLLDDIYAPVHFPIKWTAPEALFYNRFSVKSDVWSFGILLTELVTYGHIPYPGMNNREVLQQLERGYRMPCPPNTPESLYQIMLDCWKEDPYDRHTFETLQWRLEDFFFQDSVVKMYSRDLF